MNTVYNFGNVTIYYIPTDKFKNNVLDIYFCDSLDRNRAYMNALIPRILARESVKYGTMRMKSRFLKKMYGANAYSNVDSIGEIQYTNYTLDYVDKRYIHSIDNQAGIEDSLVDFIIDEITNPAVQDYNGEIGFKEEYFHQEVQKLNETIENIINDKQAYAMKCLVEEMCKEEPYSVSSLGEVEDSKDLTPQKLYKYYKDYYLKEQSIKIFFSSNSKPDQLINKIKSNQYFNSIKKEISSIGFTKKEHITICEKEVLLDVTQGKLVIGLRTNIEPNSNDYFSLIIANSVLGVGTQSKLFRKVREENSMAYYAYSSTRRYKGLIIISAGIDIKNKEKAIELIFKQLEDIKAGNISDDEINAAISMYRNNMNSKHDTQYSLIDFYFAQSFLGEIMEPEQFSLKLQQVTKEDCSRAFQKIEADTIVFLTAKEKKGE